MKCYKTLQYSKNKNTPKTPRGCPQTSSLTNSPKPTEIQFTIRYNKEKQQFKKLKLSNVCNIYLNNDPDDSLIFQKSELFSVDNTINQIIVSALIVIKKSRKYLTKICLYVNDFINLVNGSKPHCPLWLSCIYIFLFWTNRIVKFVFKCNVHEHCRNPDITLQSLHDVLHLKN